MVEIPVAGAGPAGLAAALTLARAGARPVVYERRHEVGARHHGDFQGLENYSTRGDVLEELAAIGIAAEFDCHPVAEAILYGPDGRRWRYRASTPLYYMVRRGVESGSLDQGLKRQALAHDIELRFGAALPEAATAIRATGPRGSFAIPRHVDRRPVRSPRPQGLRLSRDRRRPGDAGVLHLRRRPPIPSLPGPHRRIL